MGTFREFEILIALKLSFLNLPFPQIYLMQIYPIYAGFFNEFSEDLFGFIVNKSRECVNFGSTRKDCLETVAQL